MKKRALKITALAVASVLIIYAVLVLLPRPSNFVGENPMRKEGEKPILIAHGGGNREFPDNTLEAFYNAYSVDERVMMETDVSITKDGVVILSHDTTLDRKTNVTGNIIDWNYADLMAQKVDFGYTNPTDENDALCGERVKFTTDEGVQVTPKDVSYPEGILPRDEQVFLATTLEQLITSFPENRINVEIKQSGETGKAALKAVLLLLEKHDAFERVVLASFHEEIYAEFQALQKAGKVPETFMYSPATKPTVKFFVLRWTGLDAFFTDKMCVFQVPMEQYGIKVATRGFVRAAHRHNLATHFWTINDREDMRRLIDIGADGIMTDYPHRLQEVFDEYE